MFIYAQIHKIMKFGNGFREKIGKNIQNTHSFYRESETLVEREESTHRDDEENAFRRKFACHTKCGILGKNDIINLLSKPERPIIISKLGYLRGKLSLELCT